MKSNKLGSCSILLTHAVGIMNEVCLFLYHHADLNGCVCVVCLSSSSDKLHQHSGEGNESTYTEGHALCGRISHKLRQMDNFMAGLYSAF